MTEYLLLPLLVIFIAFRLQKQVLNVHYTGVRERVRLCECACKRACVFAHIL